MAPKAICPSCYTRIFIGQNPRLKQHIQCTECGILLEIISLNPPSVDLAFKSVQNFYEDIDFSYEEFAFERM